MEEGEEMAPNTDTVSSVDRALLGLGVAIMALLPTYLVLLFRPVRLGRVQEAGGRKNAALGPGLFFVLSFLVFVFLVNILSSQAGGDPRPVSSEVEQSTAYGAGYAAAKGMDMIVTGLTDSLSSGNIWAAAAVALPLYLFAVALAIPHFLCMRLISPQWEAERSIRLALYVLGGLMIAVCIMALAAFLTFAHVPPVVGTLIMMGLALATLISVSFQTYGLSTPDYNGADYKLVLISIAMPLVILGLIVALAFIVA